MKKVIISCIAGFVANKIKGNKYIFVVGLIKQLLKKIVQYYINHSSTRISASDFSLLN